MLLIYILTFTFIGSIASLVGSFFLLTRRRLTESFSGQIINFAAGVLLATAFLDLLPEAAKEARGGNIFTPVLLGIVIFFFAERFIQWFHGHHQHGQMTNTWLILAGDGVHNFIDGVIITASFLTSIPLGIVTSLAVGAHEIPQEIADMSVLLANGLSKKRALLYNFLSALTAFAGAILAFFFAATIRENLYIFLSLTAGFFIYISASDLIPSLHEKYLKNRRFSDSLIFISGILAVFIFSRIFRG